MKKHLFNSVIAFVLFLLPCAGFAQTINLGTAANFVLYTSVGAVTNTGITHLTGNVGSNSGSSTGFGNVDGQMHSGDGVTATCGADLLTAYGQLNTAVPTFFPAPLLGNGATLAAGVYSIAAPATLNLDLTLDAAGDPNAEFIFQIGGAFAVNALAKVKLVNGAKACNVYWKVEGLVSIAAGATMRGTIVANNAAIAMSANDTLEGRAMSTSGAITTTNILGYTPIGCGSPILTGPAAPALASTAAYGLFSSDGPVTNSGITHIIGDVGTNMGLTTGFNPLFVTGMIHPIPDGSTAACAADLLNVYTYLNTLPFDIELLYPAQFGNDLVLTPHTYLLNAATTFTGNVYLNAEGNSNAVFVIQINGALMTSTFSNVILTNGAQAKNVYWKVDGAVHIYDNSVFNGNIIANNGAIDMNSGVTLNGRALSTTGSVTSNGITINITDTAGSPCSAPAIQGVSHVCENNSTTLSDSTTGGRWTSSNIIVATIDSVTGVVHGMLAGNTIITYTLSTGCTDTMAFTVTAGPASIVGSSQVCVGSTITLTDLTPGGVWRSSDTTLASVDTGIVTGIAHGIAVISYTVSPGCAATKNVTVGSYAGVINGPSTVCAGSSIILTDSQPGGVWSSSNAHASVLAGVVTGLTAGTDTISYRTTNICGSDTATKIITVTTGTPPNAGTITGASSVCIGSSTTLADAQPGGIWSSSNTRATVLAGIVTGIAGGTDTISYRVTNLCGSDTANKTITVIAQPNAGSISGPSTVCVGSSITLTDVQPGGAWSSTNSSASVLGGIVTGVSGGIDTIRYRVTNTCGADTANKFIVVNPSPNAGTITGPSVVCVSSSVSLTDAATGGVWTSTNNTAAVVAGVVTGITAGTDTIRYTVVNTCGADTATHTIVVNPLPNAGTISGASAVCVGSSITLSDPVTTGSWTVSNANASNVNGIITGVTGGTTIASYSVTNSCGTDVATKTITIDANPAQPVISLSSAASVCDSTYFHNFGAAAIAASGTHYTWSTVNAMISDTGTTGQYALVNFKNAGSAVVVLTVTTDATGCNSNSVYNVAVTTSIADAPAKVIYFNHSFVCLQNNEEGYEWGYDDASTLEPTIITGELNQDYDNANPDFVTKNYWVRVAHNGCSQKSYCNKPTGAQMKPGMTIVTVYPNPAMSTLQVEINTTVTGDITMEVLNMLGQKMNSSLVTGNTATVDVSAYAPGVYFLNCYRNNEIVSSSRFIKN